MALDLGTLLSDVGLPALTALLGAATTFGVQERRLRAEREKRRTEINALKAAKKLLQDDRHSKRSFDAIKRRLAGFEDDQLRRILIAAGAVRFEARDGTELWGLVERNQGDL